MIGFAQPAPAKHAADYLKAAFHGRDAPRQAVGVQEQRTRGTLDHEATGDFQGTVAQIDDTLHPSSFGEANGKGPFAGSQVNVRGLDREQLMGPATGFPGKLQEISKLLVVNQGERFLILSGAINCSRLPWGGFSRCGQRRFAADGFEQAGPGGPVESPLDGDDGARLPVFQPGGNRPTGRRESVRAGRW